MARLLRIALAAGTAFVVAPYVVQGVYWAVRWVFHLPAPWGARPHAVLLVVCGLTAFWFVFYRLPNLPRMVASGVAALLTVEALSGELYWLLEGLLPLTSTIRSWAYGLGAFLAYGFWYRLIRLPKLPWLLG